MSKTKVVSARIPESTYKKMRNYMENRYVSDSDFLRAIIREKIKER